MNAHWIALGTTLLAGTLPAFGSDTPPPDGLLAPVTVEERPARLVAYVDQTGHFQANPDNVLGRTSLGHGLYGSANLVVAGRSGPELAEQIRDALGPDIAAAVAHGRGLTATPAELTTVSERSFDPGLLTPADQGDAQSLGTSRTRHG